MSEPNKIKEDQLKKIQEFQKELNQLLNEQTIHFKYLVSIAIILWLDLWEVQNQVVNCLNLILNVFTHSLLNVYSVSDNVQR